MSVSQKSSAGCGKIWRRSGYAGIAKFCWQKLVDHAGKAGRKYRRAGSNSQLFGVLRFEDFRWHGGQ